MTGLSTQSIVDWLADGARSAPESEDVLAELCGRLDAGGIPLWRVAVFVRTLHPHIMGRRFVWRAGGSVEVMSAPYEMVERAEYLSSPVVRIYATGETIRRRLIDPACPNDYPILDELRAEGVTDYLALPLVFSNGEFHVVTWTTQASNGFSPSDVAALEAVMPSLARVAEIRALRRTTQNLLATYVGPYAGQRILAGHIRLGDTEAIHAVIWLSDMRGFTALADRVTPTTLIDLLNRYFDCQVPVIAQHGGEVLKYMGDGLLAIFPVSGEEREMRETCRRALTAAREARAKINAIGEAGATGNVDRLRFGLALHIGEVSYGNIGAGNRLDFTCIGPAVNLAARLEKLAGELDRMLLTSSEFAHYCDELEPAGTFALRGFDAKRQVFGLTGDGAAPTTSQ
jgi:adenylate cyclase